MTKERLHQLFKRYLTNELTEQETVELMNYINSKATDQALEELLLNLWENMSEEQIFSQEKSEELLKRIFTSAKNSPPDHVVRTRTLNCNISEHQEPIRLIYFSERQPISR